MTTADDFVSAGSGLTMSRLETFTRLRAGTKPDPYDPDSTIADPDNPEALVVLGHLASGMSLEQPTEVRSKLVTTAQLIIADPSADVQRGDQIVGDAGKWTVQGFPERDMNPFTGWKPTLVCNLLEVTG